MLRSSARPSRLGLAAVSSAPTPTAGDAPDGLVRKEILLLRADARSPERGKYSFLQDLLRQVAYDTLPRRERKSRHLDAAAYIEQERPDGRPGRGGRDLGLALPGGARARPWCRGCRSAEGANAGRASARRRAGRGARRALEALRYFEQARSSAEESLCGERARRAHGSDGQIAGHAARCPHILRARDRRAFEAVGLRIAAARVRRRSSGF